MFIYKSTVSRDVGAATHGRKIVGRENVTGKPEGRRSLKM